MKLTCQEHDRACVMTIRGALSADQIDTFERTVRERLDGATCDVVIDASELEAIDSAGLEALIRLQEQVSDKLGQLRLAGDNPTLQTVLDITRLTGRFPIAPTVDEALVSLH